MAQIEFCAIFFDAVFFMISICFCKKKTTYVGIVYKFEINVLYQNDEKTAETKIGMGFALFRGRTKSRSKALEKRR